MPADGIDATVDLEGNVFAAWEQYGTTPVTISARRYDASDGWDSVRTVSDTYDSYDPSTGADQFGNAIAVWRGEETTNNYHVFANRYKENATWGSWGPSTQKKISSDPMWDNRALIAVDFLSGSAVVIWRNAGDNALIAALFDAVSESWKALITLAEESSNPPKVAVDFSGNVFVMYTVQVDISRDDVYARRYTLGDPWEASSFTEAEKISGSLDFDIDSNDLGFSVGPNGRAMAVWIKNDTVYANVFK
jgi:hypothetical protein